MVDFPAMPRRVRAQIGEIITLGARIEHLVTISLIFELKLEIFRGLITMQKINLNQKLTKLQYLVESQRDVDFCISYEEVSGEIEKFNTCRNILAHASFVGRSARVDHRDDYSFSDISDIGTEQNLYATKIVTYSPEELALCILCGRFICSRLNELFGVKTLPELSPGTTRAKKPRTPRDIRKNGSGEPKPRSPKSHQ